MTINIYEEITKLQNSLVNLDKYCNEQFVKLAQTHQEEIRRLDGIISIQADEIESLNNKLKAAGRIFLNGIIENYVADVQPAAQENTAYIKPVKKDWSMFDSTTK